MSSSRRKTHYKRQKKQYGIRLFLSLLTISGYVFAMINPSFLSQAVTDLPENTKHYNAFVAAYANVAPQDYIDLSQTLSVAQELNNVTYIVQSGDSLASIATTFNVSVETIKKHNSIKNDTIAPGDLLFISRSSGILYEFQEDGVLGEFAKKHDLDIARITAENFITDTNFAFTTGDQIMLPLGSPLEAYEKGLYSCTYAYDNDIIGFDRAVTDGCKTRPTRTVTPTRSANRDVNLVGSTVVASGRAIKQYYQSIPYNGRARGHCTQYAASRFFPNQGVGYKPRRGNARFWLANAAAAGYPTGTTPVVGAVVSMHLPPGSFWAAYGHVGIVEDIDRANRKILISDMNYKGLNIVTRRWISFDSARGYIYQK